MVTISLDWYVADQMRYNLKSSFEAVYSCNGRYHKTKKYVTIKNQSLTETSQLKLFIHTHLASKGHEHLTNHHFGNTRTSSLLQQDIKKGFFPSKTSNY